jgi:predicted nucleic acid-binding protein
METGNYSDEFKRDAVQLTPVRGAVGGGGADSGTAGGAGPDRRRDPERAGQGAAVTLVIDASAVAGWLLPDETGQDLASLIAAHEVILRANAAVGRVPQPRDRERAPGRLPAGMADQLIEAVEELGIGLDTAPSNAGVLALSRKHGLTGYDALYLDLALRRGTVLATLDAKLARAARAEGVGAIG